MSLLSPATIAVIGASSQEGKVGHDILKNLLTQGFKGQVFPVNVKGGEILGKQVYTSVKDIGDAVDLAVIVIPAAVVPLALKECGEKGIKSVIVISAGFSETHTSPNPNPNPDPPARSGKELEQELIDIAKQYNIHLVGPNCLGVVRPSIGMNASFAKDLPPAGTVALISQSGATAVALMDRAPQEGIGFSLMASIGNKAVMDECEWLELCEADDETKVIAFYLESIKDGRKFRDIAARVAKKKPIVLLKAGVSQHGKQAAASHTGALAGSDSAIDALCAETGIHRAHTSEELFDLLAVLSTQPQLLTNKIAIITNAGGPGILATDAAAIVRARHAAPLQLPALSPNIADTLRPLLPPAASLHNPIDVIGDAGADRYEAALNACCDDPNIDGLVVILTPQVMTPCLEVAKVIVETTKAASLMPVCACFMGGESVLEAIEYLRAHQIPVFPTPERAVAAIAALQRSAIRDQGSGMIKKEIPKPDHRSLLSDLPKGLLDEESTAKLFGEFKLPLPKQDLAKTADDAVTIAERIGYPVIMKISSPTILHKTDVGGVRANLKNKEDVRKAFDEISTGVARYAPTATINGILIQQFLPVGDEFIVGATRDASFGPLIMAGLGGIYTELFRDTAFRIAPVSTESAYEMLTELTAWKLLLGMRGKPQRDIDALATVVERVSNMMMACPEIKELDINPVLVSHNQVVIADAKVVIGD